MYGKIYQEWTILNFFLDNKNNHKDGKHYLWIYFFNSDKIFINILSSQMEENCMNILI